MRVLAITIASICLFSATTASAQRQISIATVYEIDSATLGETRDIIVSLPDGYDTSNADYPVLYMLDGGENAEHAIGTMMTLTDVGLVPPMIFVGIVSTNRSLNFTPSQMPGDENSGGADAFLSFLASELMPWVDARYRTNSHRIFEGHSYGGLFGAYALMEQPDLFDDYIILSPSLWWNGEELTQSAARHFDGANYRGKRVYFSIGDEDGWGMRQELKRFVKAVETARSHGLLWEYEEIADEEHMSVRAPAHYRALRYLFADLQLEATAETFDADAFRRHHEAIKARYGQGARPQEITYHHIGLNLLRAERPGDAVIVFEHLADRYPGYHATYNLLAMAHEADGHCKQAAGAYEAAADASTTHTGTFMRDDYLEKADRMRKLANEGSPLCVK